MSLKYDNFRFYWAAVTEKHVYIVSMQRYHAFPLEFSTFSLVIYILEK